MIFPLPPKKFKWPDLHGKILKIAVAMPDPENLEPFGQVFGLDLSTGEHYVLLEWHYKERSQGQNNE